MKIKRNAGFTLIEILVVMVIISILVGLIIGVAKYAATKAGTSRAQTEIASLENALETYKIENGSYPLSTTLRTDYTSNSGSLYAALVSATKIYFNFKPNQIRAISTTETNIIDPFGMPYNYYCTLPPATVQKNQATFDLWSYGPDNKDDNGANDDISNWKQ
jgi:general secretion pathway protein G